MKTYIGKELPAFSRATVWKKYFSAELRPFIQGDVLEVGAGIGETTTALRNSGAKFRSWTCLEPDPALSAQIAGGVTLLAGTLEDLSAVPTYDTILYVDVLEHIADDKAEVMRAAALLRPGGRLIILAPAYQRLFSEFDKALGHFRRYDRVSLGRLLQSPLRRERSFYLDSVGLLASIGNSFLLHASAPTAGQIWVWDKILVRASWLFDTVFAHRFGKSIVVVARKV